MPEIGSSNIGGYKYCMNGPSHVNWGYYMGSNCKRKILFFFFDDNLFIPMGNWKRCVWNCIISVGVLSIRTSGFSREHLPLLICSCSLYGAHCSYHASGGSHRWWKISDAILGYPFSSWGSHDCCLFFAYSCYFERWWRRVLKCHFCPPINVMGKMGKYI